MSAATYRGLLKGQGIDPDSPAITYCNSGHLSSGPWFLMSELLGNRQVRLYDGSLHQWTLEKRPLVGAVPLN
jgi:thiosulfate/3-mercaptopyruvate sulfurtransferase